MHVMSLQFGLFQTLFDIRMKQHLLKFMILGVSDTLGKYFSTLHLQNTV